MIVAHPDDEILFGGAKLLKENWKVVCVTNGNNKIRRKEFEEVMFLVGCEFEIWVYPDIQFKRFDDEKLKVDLQRVISERDWNKIITHNEQGEYGHPHHKQIHRVMMEMIECSFFDFGEKLPEEIWIQKLKLLDVYQSQKRVWSRFLSFAIKEK